MTTESKSTAAKSGRAPKRIGAFSVFLLLVVLVELFFYTWCRVQCVQTGYAIANESRKQEELRAMQNSLKIELARLKAPEMISRIARDRLSLGSPDPQQVIVMP
jgi:cell division protein FtsL